MNRGVWFWLAIITIPVWILPAIVVLFAWALIWLVLRPMFIWGMTGVFAAMGQDEWADRVAGWGPDLWE